MFHFHFDSFILLFLCCWCTLYFTFIWFFFWLYDLIIIKFSIRLLKHTFTNAHFLTGFWNRWFLTLSAWYSISFWTFANRWHLTRLLTMLAFFRIFIITFFPIQAIWLWNSKVFWYFFSFLLFFMLLHYVRKQIWITKWLILYFNNYLYKY